MFDPGMGVGTMSLMSESALALGAKIRKACDAWGIRTRCDLAQVGKCIESGTLQGGVAPRMTDPCW